VTTPYASEAFLQQLLGKALAAQASDVHLKVGQPPGARVRGSMVYFRVDKIRPEDTEAAARLLLGDRPARDKLSTLHETGASCTVPGIGRFRVHIYRQRGSLAIVMRSIPLVVPTFQELGVPAPAKGMAEQENGLVLVAGSASSGRSSTIAAMIGHVNAGFPKHVVTIEDPIEFVHEDARASVSQREVGLDTPSLEAGLSAALRQDPDLIMASEIRGPESLLLAIEAAEMGRLVLSTVAAPDVEQALRRLLAMGPRPGEVRDRLAACLQGIIAQRLLPRQDGAGLVLAAEVLVVTAPVREAIRRLPPTGFGASEVERDLEDGDQEGGGGGPSIRTLMEKGATTYGTQTFEMHIRSLAAQGLLSKEILAML
jgi:twitching motility protein PilT